MFHRTIKESTEKKNTSINNDTPSTDYKNEAQPFRKRVESSAVERYARYQQQQTHEQMDNANENKAGPVEVPNNDVNTNNTNNQLEEDNFMNNPEPQKNTEEKAIAPQNRDVNIPGNNFKRPAQAQAPQQGNRPGYPGGGYNAGAPANSPYSVAGATTSNGRKLVIGQGITMSGEIESCEHLIVEGTIEATLKGANVLDVYESGAFLGTVEIDEANIAGRFEGDITVKGRLTIESTGQVVGSISYKELSMEAGAVIDGSISPIGSTNNAAKKATSAPAKSKKASADNGAELPFSDKANG